MSERLDSDDTVAAHGPSAASATDDTLAAADSATDDTLAAAASATDDTLAAADSATDDTLAAQATPKTADGPSHPRTPRFPTTSLPHGADRYALGRELGRGGMGAVLEAEDLQFGRTVAVKRLLAGASPDARERFATEAQVTGALEHAGIPSVHERGTLSDGTPFYAMAKIEGRTLEAVIREADDAEARLGLVPILARVAQTIGFAHERGVVHRDLKPDNIIVGRHGQVVVLDWGLAKITSPEISRRPASAAARSGPADLTMDGAVLGTPAYMAPEQALGRVEAMDARTDVFGLGAILYRLLTGRAPFMAESSYAALARASEADYPPITELNPKAPPKLVALCEHALQRDPDARPRSAEALAAELDAFTRVAVSSTGARVADWVSGVVGAIAVLAISIVVIVVALSAGTLSMFGPFGIVLIVLTTLGCGCSMVEWRTKGRYHLSSFGLALAIATGAIGVGAWAMGLSQAHQSVAQVEDVALHLGRLDLGSSIALAALAFGAFLSGLQILVWGVARRRSAQARALS